MNNVADATFVSNLTALLMPILEKDPNIQQNTAELLKLSELIVAHSPLVVLKFSYEQAAQ